VVAELWSLFSRHVRRLRSQQEFYAEKSPPWLAPIVREFRPCYTIYNFRDPRDIFISANAFMKKRNYLGFARLAEDTDLDHARHLALAWVTTFENYYADRKREGTLLLRYEDFALNGRQTAGRIHQFCGIEADPDSGSEFFALHRTASDLEHSVHRWKADPVPEDVVLFLERNLHSEMAELAYPLSQPSAGDNGASISFGG
jgi:hypothetical protein